jgi:hypothetical protein
MVLRLSVNSFHYKTVRYVMGQDYFLYRVSLCKYFWTFVASVLLLPFWIFFNSLKKIHWPHVEIPKVEWPKLKRGELIRKLILTSLNSGLATAEIILHQWFWAALLIAVTFFLWFGKYMLHAIEDWNDAKYPKAKKIPKPKEPNLAVEYLKAKKGKFCPYIVWEDR